MQTLIHERSSLIINNIFELSIFFYKALKKGHGMKSGEEKKISLSSLSSRLSSTKFSNFPEIRQYCKMNSRIANLYTKRNLGPNEIIIFGRVSDTGKKKKKKRIKKMTNGITKPWKIYFARKKEKPWPRQKVCCGGKEKCKIRSNITSLVFSLSLLSLTVEID